MISLSPRTQPVPQDKLIDIERTMRNAEYEVAKAIVELDEFGVKTGRRHALAAVGQLQQAARKLAALRSQSTPDILRSDD